MQAIKSLVIGLGILIIAGLILLGYAFYARINDPEFRIMKEQRKEAAAAARAKEHAGEGFGEVDLALPDGCSVVEMEPDGKWLYLRTGPSGPCEGIMIFDPDTGRRHGAIVRQP